MLPRAPSPYAGRTVRLRADAAELGGHDATITDWYAAPWRTSDDPRAEGYRIRRGLGGLPDDDDVLFARVDGMGQLIHVSEIEGAAAEAAARGGPQRADPRAVGEQCPACRVPLVVGDQVAAVRLGPGGDRRARKLAAAGKPYESVIVELHWACATGDESYAS